MARRPRMIGITDIAHIEVERTLMGAELDQAGREAACAEAARLAAAS